MSPNSSAASPSVGSDGAVLARMRASISASRARYPASGSVPSAYARPQPHPLASKDREARALVRHCVLGHALPPVGPKLHRADDLADLLVHAVRHDRPPVRPARSAAALAVERISRVGTIGMQRATAVAAVRWRPTRRLPRGGRWRPVRRTVFSHVDPSEAPRPERRRCGRSVHWDDRGPVEDRRRFSRTGASRVECQSKCALKRSLTGR